MKNISQVIVVVCSLLTGCSWLGIEDNSNDYLLSPETLVVVVPEQLSSARLGQLYAIPPVSGDISSESVSEVPRPQPISVNTFEQLVKIQRIDEKRWILINAKPSELWPRVRNILNSSGIGTKNADGSTGIIETTWLSYHSDPDKVHRFRLSISPGVQLNSTEISVLHQLKSIDNDTDKPWPTTSDLDLKEQDMVSFIANELVKQPDYASVSLLAQDIGGKSKVEIIKPEVADPYILVNLSFDRTWASINYSASRGGFTLVDHDVTKGLLLVNYSEEEVEQDSSTISGWFSKRKNDETLSANYRILVEQAESSIEIRIVTLDGDSLSKEKALKLLYIVRSNMT
jgi:outer membrane protein assembly factor BamC